MQARRQPLRRAEIAAPAQRYFDHRRATGAAIEMLVDADLDVLWLSAAALGVGVRKGPFGLGGERLILSSRSEEEALRAFLRRLGEAPGVWMLRTGPDRWLVHAEPITPPEAARAWLLTWRSAAPGRQLWADVGAALSLTAAETRVLTLLLDGVSIADVARRQGVTVETARTHVRRIYAKTGVTNRGELFAAALPYRWS